MAYQSILNPHPVTFTWAGLTDVQLRATPVPVSFTWSGLTDAQLRATPIPVSGTVAIGAGAAAIGAVTQSGTWAVAGTGNFAITAASLPLPTGAAQDTTLTGGTARTKITDGTNNVGIADGTAPGSELTTDRLKVNAELRMLDPSRLAGTQIIPARGDANGRLWTSAIDPPAYDRLDLILTELRVISTLLQVGLSVKDEPADLRNDYSSQLN